MNEPAPGTGIAAAHFGLVRVSEPGQDRRSATFPVKAINLGSRPIAAWRSVLPLLLPFILCGCSVLFVSPYDELTDRSANELIARTETFLGRYAARTDETGKIVTSGKPYDSEAAAFYNEARGAVAAMLLRSEQKAKNEEEIEILKDLSGQYDRLEASHRLGTITKNSAAGLHRTLRALAHVQLTKKHIGTAKAATATSH